jgi:hypothetical protein
MPDEKIAAVREPGIAALFSDDEALLLQLTDAMTRDVYVPDALMDRIKARFDTRAVVETVATVAAYNMVSRFLVALQVPMEDEPPGQPSALRWSPVSAKS